MDGCKRDDFRRAGVSVELGTGFGSGLETALGAELSTEVSGEVSDDVSDEVACASDGGCVCAVVAAATLSGGGCGVPLRVSV